MYNFKNTRRKINADAVTSKYSTVEKQDARQLVQPGVRGGGGEHFPDTKQTAWKQEETTVSCSLISPSAFQAGQLRLCREREGLAQANCWMADRSWLSRMVTGLA